MKTTTLVIADDHPMVRKAVIDAFRDKDHIQFQGEAGNGKELMVLVERFAPDIAIVDLEMPGMNGYDAILELHTQYPQVKTIAFSGFLDHTNQRRAIKMGAFATISKNEKTHSFITAIEKIVAGKKYHSDVWPDDYTPEPLITDPVEKLTFREKQILNMIAEGKTSKQISEIYNISHWTVNKHRSNIKEKLNIKSLAQMIRYAVDNPDINGVDDNDV